MHRFRQRADCQLVPRRPIRRPGRDVSCTVDADAVARTLMAAHLSIVLITTYGLIALHIFGAFRRSSDGSWSFVSAEPLDPATQKADVGSPVRRQELVSWRLVRHLKRSL